MTGRRYPRSRVGGPFAREGERHETEPPERSLDGFSRRRFLTLLAASATLAAGPSCSRPERRSIVPYTKKPGDVVPGVANHYASTFQEGSSAWSVLVRTREGRPIHVEGNDRHPHFAGKTHLRAIADVLRLYDPDRLRYPLVAGKRASWTEADGHVLRALAAAAASSAPVLLATGAVVSPTRRAVIDELRSRVPGLVHVAVEPLAAPGALDAAEACFGEAILPRLRFDLADVLLALESDFLGAEAVAPVAIREFVSRRRVAQRGDTMNRLWVCEGGMSVTGGNADHRLRIRPSDCAPLAFALARVLHERHGIALPAGLSPRTLEAFDLDRMADRLRAPRERLGALAADLARAGRASLVVAGECLASEAHVACILLNVMLGGEGHTVETARAPAVARGGTSAVPKGAIAAIGGLAEFEAVLRQHAGRRFAVAVLWGTNPSYWMATSAAWRTVTSSAPVKVGIGIHLDETALDCTVVLPENHWLESWGDYEVSSGLTSLQQPAIATLYDTRQGEEILLGWARSLGSTAPASYHEYLRARWRSEVYPAASPVPFESFWNAVLCDGFLERSVAGRPARVLRADAVATAAASAARAASRSGFELCLHAATGVRDGRYANNGWLQELPDPMTRATWGNPASISPADAGRLGLSNGDSIRIEAGGRSIVVPVFVQPGQAEGVVSLALGYGRRTGGVAQGIGVDAWPLVGPGTGELASPFLVQARVAAAAGRSDLSLGQVHQTQHGRDIVRTLTLAEYAKRGFARPARELATLFPPQEHPEHKWGMAIDLTACVGCGACVVACQSENNVAVVGPEQVRRGRAMHWIRIDRYYEGPTDDPSTLHQPMLCQQCDDAPCETVCPVNATTHSPDGLNQMAYNRCVGTRYCANNCPYKVRRFNFFEYTASTTAPASLAFNPEVTVRPRGVMEKCTFCIQRIQDARERAKLERRPLRDGEIVPACAAACPARAIVFGDLKDPSSEVSRLAASDRGYRALEEIGIRPSVTYLARLTNPVVGGGGA